MKKMEDKEITYEEWRKSASLEIPEWLLEKWELLDGYTGPGPWPNDGEQEDDD